MVCTADKFDVPLTTSIQFIFNGARWDVYRNAWVLPVRVKYKTHIEQCSVSAQEEHGPSAHASGHWPNVARIPIIPLSLMKIETSLYLDRVSITEKQTQ